jgi:hypothetical protein
MRAQGYILLCLHHVPQAVQQLQPGGSGGRYSGRARGRSCWRALCQMKSWKAGYETTRQSRVQATALKSSTLLQALCCILGVQGLHTPSARKPHPVAGALLHIGGIGLANSVSAQALSLSADALLQTGGCIIDTVILVAWVVQAADSRHS